MLLLRFLTFLISLVVVLQTVFANNNLELFKLCIETNGLKPIEYIFTQNSTNSTLYEKLDYRWTSRPEHIYPLGYFVPLSTQDVQIAVRCARQLNLRLVPKSGGHSIELFSYGNADSIVIALQNMNQIQVNANETTAVIPAGATLGQIKRELWANGEFGISAGLCDDVGIGGQVLGGGQGYVSSMFGLTLDNVVEMVMVDAEGNAHTVNEGQNEDLFWGLRGSGSGFIGIVTSFKLKLFKASNLKYSVVHLAYDLSHSVQVLDAYQKWMQFTIEQGLNVSSLMGMGSDGPGYFGVFLKITLTEDLISSPVDFFKLVTDAFPPTENASISFPQFMDLKGSVFAIEDSKVPIYAKSNSFYVDQIFDSSQLDVVGQAFKNISDLPVMAFLEGYAGIFHKIPNDDSAFVHRNNLYLVSVRINGVAMSEGQIKDATAWFNDFVTVSKFMDNGESYQNYVDADLKDYMKRYYGVNAQRLLAIKWKWDPTNYFQNPQSISIF